MNRTPTRTDIVEHATIQEQERVEAIKAEVHRLVGQSVDARTNARAYRDLGDFINTYPPATPFHKIAAGELADLAHAQARNLALQADALDDKARDLMQRGLDF